MTTFATIPNFEDFDDENVYKRCDNALLQAGTLNFVIQFDEKNARFAQDIKNVTMKVFLESGRSSNYSTRWINIFGPERQKELIKELSARYRFTPRLLGLMCSNHKTPVPVSSSPAQTDLVQNKVQVGTQSRSAESTSSDLEKNDIETLDEIQYPTFDMSHYKLADEVWHYNSVDWGAKYLCISYNSLADTSRIFDQKDSDSTEATNERKGHSNDKPKGARTWTWLVLCDDGTIISIFETPFPDQRGSLNKTQREILINIRRNLRNVFSQLSRVKNARNDHPINTLEIRPGISSDQSSTLTIADSASLLFYYLFDDWYTTYALVAKDQYQYAQQLETLRQDMFSKPQVPLIDQLHQYGRELAVLKRMYQSYAHIIERILDRQKPINTARAMRSGKADKHMQHIVQNSNTNPRLESQAADEDMPPETQTLGVPLSSTATVRFERLLDRINHLALNEIQECLDEKEALVFLNFNLLAMKESQAVERLTRITILLAKVTILFMPVSIMTAYFSTQLSDLANKYTVKTYWICFGVIMALSIVFLAIFGLVSGTLEGKPIYRTLTQTIYDLGKGRWNARRDRKDSRMLLKRRERMITKKGAGGPGV